MTAAGQVGACCSNDTGEVGGLPAVSCCARRELFSFVSWHWVEKAPLCLRAHVFSHK